MTTTNTGRVRRGFEFAVEYYGGLLERLTDAETNYVPWLWPWWCV